MTPDGHAGSSGAPSSAAGRRAGLVSAAGRLSWRDRGVVAGALVYAVLGLLPWASVTLDVLGPISARGYGFTPLVPISAVLLVGAAVWVVLPAATRLPIGFPRNAVTLGLAALAFLLTLVTWLRSTDYGFEVVPLLAVLVTVAVGVCAALSLVPEVRSPSGSPPPGSGAGRR